MNKVIIKAGMTKLDKFRRLKNWSGSIKGFYCEIVCWWPDYPGDERPPTWNYYVIIRREQLPLSFDKLIGKKVIHTSSDGGERSFWSYGNIDIDMHGGITFYEPTFDDEGKIASVKIGCDYNHSWDEGRCYNEQDLLRDVKNTVEEIIEQFPEYRIRCRGNGRYYPPEAGSFHEKSGVFYSKDSDISHKLYRLFDFLCVNDNA